MYGNATLGVFLCLKNGIIMDIKIEWRHHMNKRASGILMHISSLPSQYGIGDFGMSAYQFVDFLKETQTKYWQVLPMGITSYGDSPYQSFSAFAGNPYFIDLDEFIDKGWLDQDEVDNTNLGDNPVAVDYAALYYNKYPLLRKAFKNALPEVESKLNQVLKDEDWLHDFALFMALKDYHDGRSWQEWSDDFKRRDKRALESFESSHQEDILFWVFTQYFFKTQWDALKHYANSAGIYIIGDIPIYVAVDSSDVWADPKYYKLDENLAPTVVAGVPPDLMSDYGQLWGNPIYDWDVHEADGFKWWIKRIEESFKLYDSVRIDHFRGFEAYWQIPFGNETAVEGEWVKGPANRLFHAINNAIGEKDILAEDLGYITTEVHKMIEETGYPGMNVMQFGFGGDDAEFAPHNHQYNSIAYTSNHDTMTMEGWLLQANTDELRRAKDYLNLTLNEGYTNGFIRGTYASHSYLAIIPMQDWMNLNDEARMNEPSTVGGNWMWRVESDYITDEMTEKIKNMNQIFGRIL